MIKKIINIVMLIGVALCLSGCSFIIKYLLLLGA